MYRKTADASGPFLAESGEGPAAGRRLQVADRKSPTGGWRLTAECRLRLKADCARRPGQVRWQAASGPALFVLPASSAAGIGKGRRQVQRGESQFYFAEDAVESAVHLEGILEGGECPMAGKRPVDARKDLQAGLLFDDRKSSSRTDDVPERLY